MNAMNLRSTLAPRHRRSWLRWSCLVLVSCLWSLPASAATRTVCFELQIQDGLRTNCPAPGTPGVRRACNPASSFDYAVGFEFTLWDKNPGGAAQDRQIGTFLTGGPGEQCATFEWENASYSQGEPDPDVYLQLTNRATATWGDASTMLSITVANGTKYAEVSWRDGDATNPDAYVANDCAAGASCRILPGAALVPTLNPASNYGTVLLALDSAQRAVEVFHDQMVDGEVALEFPSNEPSCPAGSACAVSNNLIAFTTSTVALSGADSAHEVGHVIQMQVFEQPSLVADCSWGGNGHTLFGPEWQSCATAEGWADYVAAVSWWDPADMQSVPVLWSFDMEQAAPTLPNCSANAWIEGQVARAFWDLDDANNEPGTVDQSGDGALDNDTTDVDSRVFPVGWDAFPDGTANHQDREASQNGVNIIDYDFNQNVDDETFRFHNCLGAQDP